MQTAMIFLSMIFINSLAWGSDCRAVQWPYAKDLKDVGVATLQGVPRENLYKYLYFEISSVPANRISGLASKLFFYLKNTELNNDRYQMIMALEWASDFQTPEPKVLPLTEICAMEDKISRQPSSANSQKKFKKIDKKKTK